MMTIDSMWATVGSTNFDNRSMAMNDELNAIFYDAPMAKRLEEMFLNDLSHSKKVSREHLENRGWFARFLGILTSPVHDYF
jgi:cardiolipin synthase A/B